MMASFCYATFSLTLSRSRRHLSARQALLWMSLGSLASFTLLELALREPLRGYTELGWAGLIGLGLVVQLLAWLIINRGLGNVSVALGTLALSVQQIATPFLAAWLLREALKPLGLLGGLLIVGGIVLVATGEKQVSLDLSQ